jgi:hypothetical protein
MGGNVKMTARYILLLLFFSGTLSADETGMKPRTVRRQKTSDVKQAIGTEFEKMLTSSSSLIASLSEVIDKVVKKLKQLFLLMIHFLQSEKHINLRITKIDSRRCEQKLNKQRKK